MSRCSRFAIPCSFLFRPVSRRVPCGLLAAVLTVLCLTGCGSSDDVTLVPVSGTITLDGQPLAGATVSFQPVSNQTKPGPGSGAVTDAEGKYALKTSEANSRAGAVVGSHLVRFTGVQDQRADDDDTQRPPAQDPVPPRYRDPGLTFDVPAAGTDTANFELTSK
jgi:hypothetical protein